MATPTLPSVAESTLASAGSTANAGLPTETAGTQSSSPKSSSVSDAPGYGDDPSSSVVTTMTSSGAETTTAARTDTEQSASQQGDPTEGAVQGSLTDGTDGAASSQPSDPTDVASTPLVSATANTVSSALDPISQSGEGNADPTATFQASLNALSVLESAFSSTVTAAAGQSGSSSLDVDPSLFSVASVQSTSLSDSTNSGGTTTEASTETDPNLTTTSDGQTVTGSGLGSVTAQSSELAVDGSTLLYTSVASQSAQDPASTVFTPSGQIYTAYQGSSTMTASRVSGQSDVVVIDGSTLSSGGPAQTIAGQKFSLGTAGLALGGSTTLPLLPVSTAVPVDDSNAVFTLGSSTLTAHPVSGQTGEIAVGDSTLSAGGPGITIGGQVVSDATVELVIDSSSTVSLPQITFAAVSGIVLTKGSSIVTATPVGEHTGEILLDDTTLSVGGPQYTINGVVVSEASSGVVVGGSTTMALSRLTSSITPTTSQTLGPYTSETPLPSTTSGGGRKASSRELWIIVLAMFAFRFSIHIYR